jgi:hypothetical protein
MNSGNKFLKDVMRISELHKDLPGAFAYSTKIAGKSFTLIATHFHPWSDRKQASCIFVVVK